MGKFLQSSSNKTALDSVQERVGLVAKFVEPDFDLTQLRGFSKSRIAKIVHSSDLSSPARSRDGIEKSIQEAQTFLQTQGKILEEIFTILSRIDEIKGYSEEISGNLEDKSNWNDEFLKIKKLLLEDMHAEFNQDRVFTEDPDKQKIRLKGEDDSRPVTVGRFDISLFVNEILKCDTIQALSPSVIRRGSNFISELLGKNSAAKMDLRSRFKLLANSREDQDLVEKVPIESHTTWLVQLFNYSSPLSVQGNINPEVIHQLLP